MPSGGAAAAAPAAGGGPAAAAAVEEKKEEEKKEEKVRKWELCEKVLTCSCRRSLTMTWASDCSIRSRCDDNSLVMVILLIALSAAGALPS